MVDMWRQQNLRSFRFTWKISKPKLVLLKSDVTLASDEIVSFRDMAKIYLGFKIDHSVSNRFKIIPNQN